MFNKPTFGSNTSGFGSFNTSATTASPFGGFKPAAGTSAFGAPPAFGSAPAQPASTGLFGASNTSTGLFGSTTATPAPAFGATSSGFGFGGGATSGGLFSSNTTTGGMFPNAQNTNAFQAKPQGFGFGSTATTGTTGTGLFGNTSAGTGLFGQQSNTLGGGGGLFSNNTSTFGSPAQQASGTAHVKYNPVVGTDVVVKSGTSQSINIKHHCITCMKEYESKSLEELRLDDYTAGRKGSTSSVFGFQQQAENKPMFPAFGQPTTTTASSVFGGGSIGTSGGFGQTSTFSFGNNAQANTNTTGLFGAAKPAFGATTGTGGGLFGATTTQAPTFGTTTPSFGFGATTQNQQSTGLFGAKPATTGFGATPSAGFGSFGAAPGGGLFGGKPASSAPAFGTAAAPAFGSLSGSFGTATSTAGGGLFGGSTFGKPPAQQPAFGFNAPSTGLNTGLGGGLGTNTFGKPAFGALGGGTLFQNPMGNTTAPGSNLGGGLGGGGIFGNNSTLGSSSLGMGGLGTNNTMNANNSLSGASAAGNVHEQILTLVARPYGDSPLFKDLPADTSASSEVLKPTNPLAVKAVLDSANAYRVSTHSSRLKLHHAALTNDKKSLFDGLEESDASLEDKLSLKPSRKRLVLRPRANTDASDAPDNRSLEEAPQNNNVNGASPKDNEPRYKSAEEERFQKEENNNVDSSGARPGSWLSAARRGWSAGKERPADSESTPRLYPNLEKEMPNPTSERRASWLTTKPLRKPLSSNPELAENSVRELGVCERDRHASTDKENVDTFSRSSYLLQSCCRGLDKPACADCERVAERIARQMAGVTVSAEEEPPLPRDLPPHPAGLKLTRPGYYTIPSPDEMIKYIRPDGSCVVPHLTIGRKNYGNVYYDCEIDVAGLDLDALVHFLNKEVTVYPDDSNKPPVGEGLNRRAIVTLDRIWPRDKTEKRPITDPDRLLAMDYEGKLRRVCDKHDTKFIEYRPQTGSWVFRVEHFSKYSLTDSDEEDDPTPEVLKRQLVNNQLQKAAPLAPPKPPTQPTGLGGLGGVGYPPNLPTNLPMGLYPGLSTPGLSAGISSPGLSTLAGPGLVSPGLTSPGLGGPTLSAPSLAGVPTGHDDLYAMHQTSLNLLGNGHKAFEMDTTEDNTESQSLYQDSHRAYGVKSPTSELARLEHRQSHNVQLMKASLYADADMEDDVSVSTGDQMVPRGASLLLAPPSAAPTQATDEDVILEEAPQIIPSEEMAMKPLIVRPHTIVLKYHRKVPPFKQTIAGRLQAACIADMSVCRARHSRVGWGPRDHLVYPTTYDAISAVPTSAELCQLSRYVRGRAAADWSEPALARLALGHDDPANSTLDILSKHLETLLEYSTFTDAGPDSAPRLSVLPEPRARRAALAQLTANYKHVHKRRAQFGVSSAYCYEVFRLCEALWGADLENDGVAGTDEASIVNRHRRLLEWMTASVADVTDDELKRPREPEEIDESDIHSERVWSLLLGGRVVEACKVCVEHGDHNMAAILAQCAGDPAFRSLVSRQVALWRSCGAESLISPYRLAALQLAGGLPPRDQLEAADWRRALHATARYLCPQVPSLEQIIRKYESLFTQAEPGEEVDLTSLEADELGMKLPLPPYKENFEVNVYDSGKQRRVLDLRYELLRARAFNSRPRLQPAAYSPDPMDYSLCFLLGAWLGCPAAASVAGAAQQLEAAGAWHLALQVLQYHPDDKARDHLIRSVLSRHAPASAPTAELQGRLQRVRKLRIPEKWLLLAQAHRAKYEHKPALEAEHLVGAEQWNAAHKVLLEELLPDAVLADDLQSIAPLLEKLNEAAQRHEVSGWNAGGQALHHYIHVCDEIRGLVSSAEASRSRLGVSARLEALRPRVGAACRALGRLRARGPRHAAARAEMGARLLQLALAAGEPPHHLAALLKALKLPPDCTTHAQQKITTDLAEQASEMCIESANSSPISSHHPATAQS